MLGEWNQTSPGAGWAMDDLELAKLYPGKWVVAIPNEVIAVGDDPNAVRAEAAKKLGLPENSMVLTMIAPLETRISYDWF
jgi:hypothetical protein